MVPTKMTKLSLYSFFRIYTQVLMPTHLMLKATNLEEKSIPPTLMEAIITPI